MSHRRISPFLDKNGVAIQEGDTLERESPDYTGSPTRWVDIVGLGKYCNGVMEDPFTHDGWYILGVAGSPGATWYGELTQEIASKSVIVKSASE